MTGNGVKTRPVNRLPKDAPTMRVTIPPLNLQRVVVRLVGETPLIVHPKEEKAMAAIRSDDAVRQKKAKETEADAERRRRFVEVPKDWPHWMADPKKRLVDAFPAVAFKRAAVRACKYVEGIDMVDANIHLQVCKGSVLVPLILEGPPEADRDYPRLQGRTPDLRFRPSYFPWAVDLEVEFDADNLSVTDVFNLFNRGGRAGVGEKRPEKGYSSGMFAVSSSE